MKDDEIRPEEDILVDAIAPEVEIRAKDLPPADESGVAPSLAAPGEPEPYDLSGEVSGVFAEPTAEEEAAMERAYMETEAPTPESVAAELHEVAKKPFLRKKQTNEKAQDSVDSPAPKKKMSPIWLILFALIVVAGLVVAILVLIKDAQPKNSTSPEQNNEQLASDYDYVSGTWESQVEGGSCYIFSSTKTFYLLNVCAQTERDYYTGSVTNFLRGQEALKKVGKTVVSIKSMLQIDNLDISENDIYYIQLTSRSHVVGADTKMLSNGGEIELLFVRQKTANIAYGYQINSGDMYVFSKSEEMKAPAITEPAISVSDN